MDLKLGVLGQACLELASGGQRHWRNTASPVSGGSGIHSDGTTVAGSTNTQESMKSAAHGQVSAA